MLNTQIRALKDKVEDLQLLIAETQGVIGEGKARLITINRTTKMLDTHNITFAIALDSLEMIKADIIDGMAEAQQQVDLAKQQIKKLNKAIVTLEGLANADGITT